MRDCYECSLHNPGDGLNPVPGLGAIEPWIMEIGEAPGYWEDQQQKPFVGASGQELQWIHVDLDLTIRDIYISNVAHHRPADNRTPTVDEIKVCANLYLVREIELVRPRVIVCLGRTATTALHKLTGKPLPRSSLRGYQFKYKDIPVVSTWHPCYACIYTPEKKPELVNDLKLALRIAGHPRFTG